MLKISNGRVWLTLNGTDISLNPRFGKHGRRGQRLWELNHGQIYSKRVSAGHGITLHKISKINKVDLTNVSKFAILIKNI